MGGRPRVRRHLLGLAPALLLVQSLALAQEPRLARGHGPAGSTGRPGGRSRPASAARKAVSFWRNSLLEPRSAPVEIAPDVFQLQVRGRTSVFLLLGPARSVSLIDSGLPGSTGRIERALQQLGRELGDVEQVVITHAHVDHAGGLAGLLRHGRPEVAVHLLEAPLLEQRAGAPPPHTLHARLLRALNQRLSRPMAVDRRLADGDELDVLGGLRVIHTPGHTPGHISLLLPSRKLLIAGDALELADGARVGPPHRLFSEDHPRALASMARLDLDVETIAWNHYAPLAHDARAELQRAIRAARR